MKSVIVLCSGNGTNYEALYYAQVDNQNGFCISAVITNNHKAGVRKKALNHMTPCHVIDDDQVLLETLQHMKPDLIVLAGYMKYIPPEIIQAFPNRILNIHPSLLPAFGGKGMYGMKVHEAVLARGCQYTGVTVHVVDEQYDHGHIIAQRAVKVVEHDTPETLQNKVALMEHEIYFKAIRDYVCTL